jgi:hypothetical protein
MPKLNWKMYLALLVVLVFLIIALTAFSSKKPRIINQQQSNIPTPTTVIIIPTFPSEKIVLTPRFTGANESIPSPVLDFAKQKQELKKKTPLAQNIFTLTYDYQSDTFVVVLAEPKQDNKTVFEQWLQQNYPLIPLNKFLFK